MPNARTGERSRIFTSKLSHSSTSTQTWAPRLSTTPHPTVHTNRVLAFARHDCLPTALGNNNSPRRTIVGVEIDFGHLTTPWQQQAPCSTEQQEPWPEVGTCRGGSWRHRRDAGILVVFGRSGGGVRGRIRPGYRDRTSETRARASVTRFGHRQPARAAVTGLVALIACSRPSPTSDQPITRQSGAGYNFRRLAVSTFLDENASQIGAIVTLEALAHWCDRHSHGECLADVSRWVRLTLG
jgi:hypothetical protein